MSASYEAVHSLAHVLFRSRSPPFPF